MMMKAAPQTSKIRCSKSGGVDRDSQEWGGRSARIAAGRRIGFVAQVVAPMLSARRPEACF